jgi:hypothetical protein
MSLLNAPIPGVDDLPSPQAGGVQLPSTPEAPQEERPGIARRVARDVVGGLGEAIPQAARGALTGLRETAETIQTLATGVGGMSGQRPAPADDLGGRILQYAQRPLDAVADAAGLAAGGITAVRDLLPEAGTVTGGITGSVGQFIAGNILAGRLLRAVGVAGRLGTVGNTVARDALGSAIAFDPREERLSNFLREHAGLADPITAFLAARPDDGEVEGRLKNAIENAGLGLVGEAVFQAIRARRALRNGDAAEAAEASRAAEAAVAPEALQEGLQGELRGMVAEERWLRQTETTRTNVTETTTTRDTETTTTTRTGEAPAPVADTGVRAGGEVPQPMPRLEERDIVRLGEAVERARGNPALLDSETIAPLWRNLDKVRSEEGMVAWFRESQSIFQRQFEKAAGDATSIEAVRRAAVGAANDALRTAGVDQAKINTLLATAGDDLEALRRIGVNALSYSHMVSVLERKIGSDIDSVIRLLTRDNAARATPEGQARIAQFTIQANMLKNLHAVAFGIRSQMGRNLSMLGAVIDGADTASTGNGFVREPGALREVTKTTKASTTRTTTRTTTRVDDVIEGGERSVLELAYRLKKAKGSPEAAVKIASKHFETGGNWDSLGSYWLNSLLSSVKTQMVGAVSSTFRTLYAPAEQAVAGVIQGTLMRPWGGDFHLTREAFYQYRGLMHGIGDAISLARRAMDEGDSLFDPTTLVTEKASRTRVFGAEQMGAESDTLRGSIINGLGTLAGIPSRLLVGQDEFFKVLNYRARIYAQARREAADIGADAKGTQDLIEARLAAAFDENTGLPVDEGALGFARNITFTDQFGDGWLSQMGEAVQAAKARAPGLMVIMPFVRVPTNVLREGLTYTPGLNLIQKEFREEIMAGGERSARAMARLSASVAVGALFYDLAMEGRITGSGPIDPKTRGGWASFGWAPNSIMVPDGQGGLKAIDYSRLDPYALPLSLMASFVEISQELASDTSPAKLQDAFLATVLGMAQAFASRTYATGIIQFADILRGGGGMAEAAINSLAGTLMPAAARDASVALYGNNTMRQANTILDALKARTALAGEVDARYSALGEPRTMPAGFMGPIQGFIPDQLSGVLSPVALRRSSGEDRVAKELLRLQMQHYSSFQPPPWNPEGTGIDLRDYHIPGRGTAYGRLQALVGEVEIGGRTLRDRLDDLISSPRYERLTDGTADVDGSRLQAVQAIMQTYRRAAMRELRKEMPEVDDAIRERRAQQRDIRTMGGPQVAPPRDLGMLPSRQLTLDFLFSDQP